jgi:hypothetical protein
MICGKGSLKNSKLDWMNFHSTSQDPKTLSRRCIVSLTTSMLKRGRTLQTQGEIRPPDTSGGFIGGFVRGAIGIMRTLMERKIFSIN